MATAVGGQTQSDCAILWNLIVTLTHTNTNKDTQLYQRGSSSGLEKAGHVLDRQHVDAQVVELFGELKVVVEGVLPPVETCTKDTSRLFSSRFSNQDIDILWSPSWFYWTSEKCGVFKTLKKLKTLKLFTHTHTCTHKHRHKQTHTCTLTHHTHTIISIIDPPSGGSMRVA